MIDASVAPRTPLTAGDWGGTGYSFGPAEEAALRGMVRVVWLLLNPLPFFCHSGGDGWKVHSWYLLLPAA